MKNCRGSREKVVAAGRGIIKFLRANEIITEAVGMSAQESRTCRAGAFVSIVRYSNDESHGAKADRRREEDRR